VLVLTILVIGGLYVVREQLSGAGWTRPFDATPTPTRTSESYFDEAEVLYQDGLLDEAIVAYQNAFRADPEDNIALFRLVRLMTFRQRTDEVLEQYGARLQDEELGDARTLAVLGMVLDWHAVVNSEDLLPIYIELDVVKDQDVQEDDWEYSRERMARQLVRAAQKMCEQALRLDADFPEGYAYMAETLADRERFDEALDAAQTAVELNPNLPDTQRALAYVHETQGEYELAVQAYQEAINAHPRLSYLHIAIGKNYRAIGFRLNFAGKQEEAQPYFEQAIASFEEAIKLDPSNPESYDEIGWTFGHYMGDDREMKQRGVDYLEEAIGQNPEYALAYRHLGQVFYDLRNYEEAIPAFEAGLELGGLPPADAILSHIMLGWSYYVLDLDDEDVEDPCVHAVQHFRAAWDALDELPQRELGLEGMARDGLDECK
jgi:tetratricopeptide (TPR) repeat protein